ncbi:protein RCC2-like [Glandiceps talaboti]
MPRGKRKTPEEGGRHSKKYKSGAYSLSGGASSSATDNGSTEEKPKEERMKIRLEGSKTSGEVLFCGGTNWDLIGRASLPKAAAGAVKKPQGGRNLWGPHRLASLSEIRVRTVVSGPSACHSILITTEGKAMSWGRNDREQLGHGDAVRRDIPTPIEGLEGHNIVAAACGRNHTLCLTEYGSVYSFGDNRYGQLGLGHQSQSVGNPVKISYKGQPIVKVACGADFSMILDCKGSLHSFGHPEYSQLGHNNDGQYFVTSTKHSFDCQLVPRKIHIFTEKTREGHIVQVHNVLLTDVVCGNNHTVALDIRKRVFTWGFGGYGRLGHAEPKDEKVARNLKTFDVQGRGVGHIHAGSSFSMAVTEQGQLYFWGQTKTTGEATMYPKPVQDLTGWKIRCVGCSNHSIVIAADDSVISWGPAPTYGELGHGDNAPKSSTQPKEVKLLEGVFIHSVSCGFGHTLMVARSDTEEEKERLRKLPALEIKP